MTPNSDFTEVLNYIENFWNSSNLPAIRKKQALYCDAQTQIKSFQVLIHESNTLLNDMLILKMIC